MLTLPKELQENILRFLTGRPFVHSFPFSSSFLWIVLTFHFAFTNIGHILVKTGLGTPLPESPLVEPISVIGHTHSVTWMTR